jgi:uncharacterized protein YjbI with pentapeptide repeats
MDPTVVAAWIAAGVSMLTLIGTLVAQYLGHRAASRDAEKTAEEQRKQAEEQRKQLDRTLAEQNQQLDRTLAEQRTRTLNERFATAADRLGDDKPPAVRLAGVYAMAGLADDWPESRQTCVDVLCAYLRMPYEPDPGPDAPAPQRLAYQAGREVRHTVIRVITTHLQEDAATSWQRLDLDFTGVVFDGGDFSGARFSGTVSFIDARFSGGEIYFLEAQFSGEVSFNGARFSGGEVNFAFAQFSGGEVSFGGTEFSGGEADFGGAQFTGGMVKFIGARFTGGEVNFGGQFSGGMVTFYRARFSGGTVRFYGARFTGGKVNFDGAQFFGGEVSFGGAEFSGGTVNFSGVAYSSGAEFSGGTVDFSNPRDWSFPPAFPWTHTPPSGVKLPPGVA